MIATRSRSARAAGFFLLAAVIGILGGLLGVLFFNAVKLLQALFMGQGGSVVEAGRALPIWARIAVPTAGGLLAGCCLLAIKSVRGPFGIGDVLELVATRSGTIRPLRSLVQILSSALTIASGGSIGREGANSQFGATVASVLAAVFRVSSRNRSVLLGCGIAAGMASAYKAPIAGALFVMEVVLGNFAMDVLAPIVVASVLSTLVTRAFVDYTPIYEHAGVSLESSYLILSAMLLGALCGFGGVAFRHALATGTAVFARSRLPFPIRMAIGGCLVGIIGIWLPEVWGNGQLTIDIITAPVGPTLALLASLTVMKVVATSVTAGSGALGGVFTPNLVVGAAFGAAFASIVQAVAPGSGDHRIAFALVGMAGMCAATTHAPITAIILVFEMTGDYALILPLMLCAILGSLSARLLDEDSIYTARLRARGHGVHQGIEELAIHSNYVRDIQRTDHVAVHHHTKFDTVLDKFGETRRATIYVVDDDRRLLGQIHLHDVKYFINDATLGSVVIAADLTRPIPHVRESESLAAIIDRFDDPDIDELPVVDDEQNRRLTGRITRRDLVTCLSEEVLGQRQLRVKFRGPDKREATYVELPAACELDAIAIPESLAGRALDSLDLRDGHGVTPMIYVHTGEDGREERVLPRPALVLQPGARLIVLGERDAIGRLKAELGVSDGG